VTELHNGNCHILKLGKAYSPISKRCHSKDETVLHVINGCEILATIRLSPWISFHKTK